MSQPAGAFGHSEGIPVILVSMRVVIGESRCIDFLFIANVLYNVIRTTPLRCVFPAVAEAQE